MVKKGLLWILLLYAESLAAQRFGIAVTELMADPLPSVGLPAEEFLELTNVSGEVIDLSRWQISNGRTTGVLPDSLLLSPDSILIICADKARPLFEPYGRTLSPDRFPVISNAGDTLLLMDANGNTVHAVAWHPSMMPEGKTDGGWSLEMVNPRQSCSFRNNWKASSHSAGGSPGKQNNQDTTAHPFVTPSLVHAWSPDPQRVILEFDDAIDPEAAENTRLYQTEPALVILRTAALPPLFNQIECELAEPLQKESIHWLSMTSVTACQLHPSGGTRRVKLALPANDPRGIILNELMNNPPAGGVDYVELYNAGKAVVNLQGLSLANRNSRGEPASIRQISAGPRYLFPGDFMAISTNPKWLQRQYHTADPFSLLQAESTPSWPDQRGTVLLLARDSTVMDELAYEDNWHFELVRNREGVALERTDPARPAADRNNWHSAAMHVGYGTPGYMNSQRSITEDLQERVWPESAFFTPDGDGQNETCRILYRFPLPGFVCTIRIYDRSGLTVRNLVNNGLCGISGQFEWNGRNDQGNPLAPGIYFLVAETFHLSGKTKRYRETVTLLKPFR